MLSCLEKCQVAQVAVKQSGLLTADLVASAADLELDVASAWLKFYSNSFQALRPQDASLKLPPDGALAGHIKTNARLKPDQCACLNIPKHMFEHLDTRVHVHAYTLAWPYACVHAGWKRR